MTSTEQIRAAAKPLSRRVSRSLGHGDDMVMTRFLVLQKIESSSEKVSFSLVTEAGEERAFELRVDHRTGAFEDVSGEFTRFIWSNRYGDAMRPIGSAVGRFSNGEQVALPLTIPCGDV